MPYNSVKDLPESVKSNLPLHAQEIYLESFNNAWIEYRDPKKRRISASREEVARRVAWSAVKKSYEKIKDKWLKKKTNKKSCKESS
jgi:cation transport regulator